MNEEEYKKKIAELEASLEEAKKANNDEELEKLKKDLEEKDTKIKDLEEITRTQSGNFKRLKDMNKKELEAMTESERALKEQIDTLQEALEKKTADDTEKEKARLNESRDKIISLYVGSDEAKKKAVLDNYNRLSDPEDSEDVVRKKVGDAVRLAGISVDEEAISRAHNMSGGDSARGGDQSFAETEEGKGLAKMLGFGQAEKKDNAGEGEGGGQA